MQHTSECSTCGYSSVNCTCPKDAGFTSDEIVRTMRSDISRMRYTSSHARHITSKVGKRVRPLPGMVTEPTKGNGWKLTQEVK